MAYQWDDFLKLMGYSYGGEDGDKMYLDTGDGERQRIWHPEQLQDQGDPAKQWFDLLNKTDAQGRPVYGTEFFTGVGKPGSTFEGQDYPGRGNIRYRLGQGWEQFTPEQKQQFQSLGLDPSQITYDEKYGYNMPMWYQDEWHNKFQAPGQRADTIKFYSTLFAPLLAAAGQAITGVAGSTAGSVFPSGAMEGALSLGAEGLGTAGALGGTISQEALDAVTNEIIQNATNWGNPDYFQNIAGQANMADGGFNFADTFAQGANPFSGDGFNWQDLFTNVTQDGAGLTNTITGLPSMGGQALMSANGLGGALDIASLLNSGAINSGAGVGGLTSILDAIKGIPGVSTLGSKLLGGLLNGGDGKAGTGVLGSLLGLGGGLGNAGLLDLLFLGGGLLEGNKNTTSSETVSPPDWYKQAGQDLIAKAGAITPSQEWRPYFDTASTLATNASKNITDIDLGKYTNPYLQQVLDPMKRRADLEKTKTLQDVDTRAAQLNAFGRNRHSLIKNQAAESADRNWNETEANIRSGAFGNAQQAALADLSRQGSLSSTFANMGNSVGALSQNDKLLPIIAGSTALKSIAPGLTKTAVNPPPSLLGQAAGALGVLNALS